MKLTATSINSSFSSVFINFCIKVCTPFNLTNKLLFVRLSAVKLFNIPNEQRTD